MRSATKPGPAITLSGDWDAPAWDRAMARWAGESGDAGFGARDEGADAGARGSSLAVMSEFPAIIDLATLDGSNGFRLVGVGTGDGSGGSVSSAGDMNGDGYDDIIIGAYRCDPGLGQSAGTSYVVFGKAGGFDASLDLAALDGTDGFRLRGVDGGDFSGFSVSSAGDVNGDGYDDIIIGAPGADFGSGASYVVFGHAGGFDASLNLAALDGTDGFRLDGANVADGSGVSVSTAGDVNGDGFDDLIIGADGADPGGDILAGESYIVFGHAGGFDPSIDLATLDGTNGIRLNGIDSGDFSGRAVSDAGDVNGDGFDDVIIGATFATSRRFGYAGESYVVFGRADGFAAGFDLKNLDGTNGFRIDGVTAYDYSGVAVSSAGDINGDGFDDIIIGAGYSGEGTSYVVFGHADGFDASLKLKDLDGTNGFRVDSAGIAARDGYAVSAAGDVNGDGFDDILIGARDADVGSEPSPGESYVVFGHAGGFDANLDLLTLDGTNGFRVQGVDAQDRSGYSVASAGDVDGDGFDDIMIGAPPARSDDGVIAGESYVVFGRAPDEAVTRIGSAADQTIRGGDFDDTLKGWGGDDMLAGGAGRDELKGGKGADDFLLASIDQDDADTILDFGRGNDRIALDGDAFGLTEGALAAKRFVIGDAAGDANDRLIYDDATGRLFFDADGTGAQAQVLIATLTGAPVLTAGDFLVI